MNPLREEDVPHWVRVPGFGAFRAVHSKVSDVWGELRYLSLRSVSVPYPLSLLVGLPSLGRRDFELQVPMLLDDCIEGVLECDTPLDSARRLRAVLAHWCTILLSITIRAKPGSSGTTHNETKSTPNNGVNAYRML